VKLRLFAAIDINAAAQAFVEAVIARLREAGFEARFEPREKWHATVAFLGAVEAERYPAITAALGAAAAASSAFALTLDRLGAFPSMNRPRVLWVGSSAEQPAYARLAANVCGALTPLGFSFDNDAVAHVTLCRIKQSDVRVPTIALPDAIIVPVTALSLYQSIPDGRTTRYALRERFALRQA
jgi:RNA 2',3'-cyclic 3'-phosphodiesterase